MNQRILWTAFKYLLAAALLTLVIWLNWGHPENPDDRGLGYIWQRHVVRGEPIHYGYLGLAFLCFAIAAPPITLVPAGGFWYAAQDLPFTIGSASGLEFAGTFLQYLPAGIGRRRFSESGRHCPRTEPAHRGGGNGYHGPNHRPMGFVLASGNIGWGVLD